MMLCDFKTVELADGRFEHACRGHRRTSRWPRCVRACDCLLWGDRLARWLSAVGLTRGAYARWVGRPRWCVIGGMNCVLVYKPTTEAACGCHGRKQQLNRWAMRWNRWVERLAWRRRTPVES